MEDNELRDIILEKNDEQKSLKIKKLLMFIAMFFILFLIVLITMKIINSDDGAKTEVGQDSRLVLPPEPEAIKNAKGGDDLFQQVPIIPENKNQDSFEDMVKSLKDKESQKQIGQVAVVPSEDKTLNVQELVKQQQVAESTSKNESDQESLKEQSRQVALKEQPTEVKTKPETKPAINSKEQAKKPEVAKPSIFRQASSGSYIQIVAVKNFNENATEIRKLRSYGYTYKLHKVSINGIEMTKVIVGPYSQDAIKSELAKIKSNVSSGAFIINIK